MSAIIAVTAGREAFEVMPTSSATAAIAAGRSMNPSSATENAVESCAASSVGRRPSRSVITPATSEDSTPPSPWRARTRPANEAE